MASKLEINSTIYSSPLGPIKLSATPSALISLEFLEETETPSPKQPPTHPILIAAITQIKEYFSGLRHHFDLPLSPTGTTFQQRVWQALVKIPYGATTSYLNIAQTIDKSSAARAVGAANGKNPISIIVPCHRVIGKDGSLTGYAGGLERKQWLLNHEQKYC